ncbi:hypothetical protein G6677_00210 [Polynucleobacter paneuropaeus]|nr:hypothetical protein [Polynucleobacter paneuropaeus]
MRIKLIILGLLISSANVSHAETIWCKMFNAGCITEEQKQKQLRFCQQTANEVYAESLDKAIADSTLWQYAGEKSAQSYAIMTQRGVVSSCLKRTTPHNF